MADSIFIVEDEEHIAKGIQFNLEAEGFRAKVIADGLEAIRAILDEQPDLVILDVMLPGVDGFSVCEKVRTEGSRVPILFLTVRDMEDDRIRGLDLGGDDYMTKPFSVRELLHRIRAILRREEWYRQSSSVENILEFGGNRIDFAAFKVWTREGEIQLTQKECMLLKLLAQHQGEVVGRDTILNTVWGYNRYPSTRTIDNLVVQLRKILEKDPKHPKHLQTLYGAGYRFTIDESE
ncbi:response regulator transcription factor [bacterium]|nr:response regulator transcription factor [bacterium]